MFLEVDQTVLANYCRCIFYILLTLLLLIIEAHTPDVSIEEPIYYSHLEACLYDANNCEQVIFQYTKFYTSVCSVLIQRAFLRQIQQHTNTYSSSVSCRMCLQILLKRHKLAACKNVEVNHSGQGLDS